MSDSQLPELVLSFDTSVYRLSAIKKAAYRFGDRCSSQIKMVTDSDAEITLWCKNRDTDVDRFAADFSNEVLDQELREVVAEETAGVRNLLMAQAFSPMSLTDREGETTDYKTDPLGIGRPDNP